MRQREEMITRLEWANEQLWKSGKCQQWFRQCDDGIKRVSEGVNGYLLQELLRASRHCDLAVVELFREVWRVHWLRHARHVCLCQVLPCWGSCRAAA